MTEGFIIAAVVYAVGVVAFGFALMYGRRSSADDVWLTLAIAFWPLVLACILAEQVFTLICWFLLRLVQALASIFERNTP